MEYSSLSVPYSYANMKADFSWKEMLFAIDHNILSSYSAVEHAMEELKYSDEYSDSLVELASLNEGDSVRDYVLELANLDVNTTTDPESKWLYVLLSWVYENRRSFEDALQVVELIYADFNYPQSIEPFVRYMPSDNPSLGNTERDIEMLYEEWKAYLLRQSVIHNPKTS